MTVKYQVTFSLPSLCKVHKDCVVYDPFCHAVEADGLAIHSFSFVYSIPRGKREREGSHGQAEPELDLARTRPELHYIVHGPGGALACAPLHSRLGRGGALTRFQLSPVLTCLHRMAGWAG